MVLVEMTGTMNVIPFKLSEIELKNKSKSELYKLYVALLQQHEQLINEFNIIHTHNKNLEFKNDILTKQLDLNLITIKKLSDEIIYLKNKNEYFEKQIIEQNNKIAKQDDTIIELNNKIAKQDDTIIELKNTITDKHIIITQLKEKELKREEKELYITYIKSIQDLNNRFKLEKTITSLATLRGDRNNLSHFLNIALDQNEIDTRLSFLADKINDMPTNIKQKFDKYYPNLINDIIAYIQNNIILKKISDDDEERINDIWSDM